MTAKIKYGPADPELLDQTEWWVDKRGTYHKVSELDAGYAKNIIKFLERRAQFYVWHESDMLGWNLASGVWSDTNEDLLDDRISWLDEISMDEHSSKRWLWEHPLLFALQKQASQLPKDQRPPECQEP